MSNLTPSRGAVAASVADESRQGADEPELPAVKKLWRRVRWLFLLNVGIACASLLQAYFAYRSNQLTRWVINQTQEHHSAIVAENRRLTNEAIRHSDQVAREGREQVERLTAEGLDEARRATRAAVEAVGVARQANAQSLESFRIDQRPWLGITGYAIWAQTPKTIGWKQREPVVGDEFRFRFTLTNTGKSPALRVWTEVGQPMFGFVPDGQLPPEPKWSGVRNRAGSAIYPNDDGRYIESQSFPLNEKIASNYRAGRGRLHMWARTYYCDVNGRRHWFQVAVAHPFGPDEDAGRFTVLASLADTGLGDVDHPDCQFR